MSILNRIKALENRTMRDITIAYFTGDIPNTVNKVEFYDVFTGEYKREQTLSMEEYIKDYSEEKKTGRHIINLVYSIRKEGVI